MSARIVQRGSRIFSNSEIAQGVFLLELAQREIAQAAQPGQFVHMRIERGLDPFLRRPFAICRADPGTAIIQILYEVVGRGTEVLSRKRDGDAVSLVGPLGKGYRIPSQRGRRVLVAGGRGIASLVLLAERLLREKETPVVLIGARSRDRLFFADHLRGKGADVYAATEDGSEGYAGMVTDLLDAYAGTAEHVTVFACGPESMLKQVALFSVDRSIPCQLSLEARMPCGLGACQGCAVEVRPPAGEEGPRYKSVCVDGPVFDAREVIL